MIRHNYWQSLKKIRSEPPEISLMAFADQLTANVSLEQDDFCSGLQASVLSH